MLECAYGRRSPSDAFERVRQVEVLTHTRSICSCGCASGGLGIPCKALRYGPWGHLPKLSSYCARWHAFQGGPPWEHGKEQMGWGM